jgi:hypothetical protein
VAAGAGAGAGSGAGRLRGRGVAVPLLCHHHLENLMPLKEEEVSLPAAAGWGSALQSSGISVS